MVVQVESEHRAAERPQRQPAAFGVEVDLGAVDPIVGDGLRGLGHVPAEFADVVFGEDRLQRASARQPGFVGEVE